MTTKEIIEKTRLETERFINLIKEKGEEDDILYKSFHFKMFLTRLMDIKESIDIEKEEKFGYLSNK
jgi:hypothetical protein